MTQYTINLMIMDTTVVGDITINDGDGCYQSASTDDTIWFANQLYGCCQAESIILQAEYNECWWYLNDDAKLVM